MKALSYIVLSVLLGACTFIPTSSKKLLYRYDKMDMRALTNPEFYAFQELFIKQVADLTGKEPAIYWIPIKMQYDLGGNYLGLCRAWATGHREIIISIEYWNRADFSCKKQLIVHELGHCLLDRPHKDGMYRYFPKSIMNTTSFSCAAYERFEEGYLRELLFNDEIFLKNQIDQYWEN